ncbi:hypothetical protein EVA_17922 [gut metagenome]|uniref:Uncharacterized protein n=1 Tax=gut metagenome TaxID=749906 RepID=J9FWM7_9ZZZZ
MSVFSSCSLFFKLMDKSSSPKIILFEVVSYGMCSPCVIITSFIYFFPPFS